METKDGVVERGLPRIKERRNRFWPVSNKAEKERKNTTVLMLKEGRHAWQKSGKHDSNGGIKSAQGPLPV